ncbi:MAG: phytanoyl-CoA dioxygenase family protein [Planctomycetes bacterium]|nr:phytanoyl-CoA dioxygenase family protein [Planctomycetota bacterium]
MSYLTPQQMSFFDTFGYLAFPGLLNDRIAKIIEAFEELWALHGGGHNGKPHDGKQRSCLAPCADRSEYLSSLLDDPRIEGIAASVLGDDFNYGGSDGNLYAGDTGWHSDGWNPSSLNIKFAFYLDPVGRDTGCLRVIPGSHRIGEPWPELLQKNIGRCQEVWGVGQRDIPALALETKPGDLVMFNHNTKHAAFGGSARRRMFTLNCGQRVPEDRLQELRNDLAGAARFWVDRAYGEAMIRTAGPRRMVHLEQLLANDGHLAELSRKAREKMSEPSRG